MNKVVFSIFIFILIASITQHASAVEVKITDVKIDTAPLRDVTVIFYEEGTEDIIQQFDEKSYLEGSVSFKFYTIESNFDYEVIISRGDTELERKKEEGHKAGSPIELTLGIDNTNESSLEEENSPEESTTTESQIDEETINEEAIVEEENKNNSTITGGTVSGDFDLDFSNLWYYLAGGLLVAGLLGFLVTRKIFASHGEQVKFTQKPSQEQKPLAQNQSNDDINKRIADAENKIKEAQDELRKIRENEKIKIAEKRIQRDIDELNKLKKEKQSSS